MQLEQYDAILKRNIFGGWMFQRRDQQDQAVDLDAG
jgi:hypothetical protein